MSEDTVRVALRIRPLVSTEVEKGCQTCVSVVPGEQQIKIGNGERSFTFNHVFGPATDHEYFYNTAVKSTVSNIFKGYNVTILAYGQTGSGKTFTMGTNYNGEEAMGVIPRAVHEIFDTMTSKNDCTFKVAVSFMELYQEQLYDLLADKQRNERIVDIREDVKGIKIVGLTEKVVTSASETLQALAQGSNERATGATAMNVQSSRSHAIFTIIIHQAPLSNPNGATTSKFHLVDLAGSERSKKTQATGERFKEGVNINKGLLALGNVISQLGEGGSATYIGYRDSKLTRLLQDSLGGNSMTLMVACVSPADYNLDETLSTLRYADRARKIKNKPIVNQDPKAAEINRLNNLVQELRLALLGQGNYGSCPAEHEHLQEKVRLLQKKLRELTEQLNANLIEVVNMHERAELAEKARETIKLAMTTILEEFEKVFEKLDPSSPERAIFEPVYKKFIDLHDDQKKTAEEILQHELTAMCSIEKSIGDEGSIRESIDDNQSDDANDGDQNDLDEKHTEHTLRQAERNHEVQNINRALAIKEELVSTLLRNSSQIAETTKELQIMENEIKTLQSEKEELLHALQNVQTNNASAKLAASRRKKVQELEKRINELTKKCLEQTRIIKKNEKSDEQMRNLSAEIHSLKQSRVRLIREMRKETEAFGKWKRASEREMYKLKDQDRKRQNELAKLQTQHNKQKNVFKRKMEEACAINKRLKEALELQRKAQQRREKNASSKEGNIRDWIQQECAVLTSTIDAELSLEKLMQDRADLAKQLEILKAETDKNPQAAKHIDELNEYLDLRNVQISDLQQEIIESDQESRGSTRLNSIQSMSDAKTALKVLFETIAAVHKKNCGKIQELENKDAELMDKYDAALMKIRQYELRDRSNDKLKELEEELESYKEKCDRLEEKLAVTVTSSVMKERKKASIAPRTRRLSETDAYNSSFHITDVSSSEDDDNNDPDWKKTPLYKRIQKARTSRNRSGEISTAAKRSSDGDIKCACKSQCSTRLCTCRRNNVNCTNCNCNPEMCQNKNNENIRVNLFTDFNATADIHQNDDKTKRPRLAT